MNYKEFESAIKDALSKDGCIGASEGKAKKALEDAMNMVKAVNVAIESVGAAYRLRLLTDIHRIIVKALEENLDGQI